MARRSAIVAVAAPDRRLLDAANADRPGDRDLRHLGLGATCSTPFTVGPGEIVVIAKVAFPQPSPDAQRHCTISLTIVAA